jgi:hypothetical protein
MTTYAPRLTQQQIINAIWGWTDNEWVNNVWTPGLTFQAGPSRPINPDDKTLFFDTGTSTLWQYQTSTWVNLHSPANEVQTRSGSDPPSPNLEDFVNRYDIDVIKQYMGPTGGWVGLGSNNEGLPTGTTSILSSPYTGITFIDTDKNKSVSLYVILVKDNYYTPLLAIDQGVVVKKDVSAGGFFTTQQGAVWFGHGLLSSQDVPKIILSHADSSIYGTDENGKPYDTLYLKKFINNGTDQPANLNLGKLEVQSPNNVFALAAGDNGLNSDTYLIPQNPSAGGLGIGTYDYPFKWIDSTYVFTKTINTLNQGYVGMPPIIPNPESDDHQFANGNLAHYWGYVAAYTVYYHSLSQSLDALDDLSIIMNYRTKTAQNPKTGEAIDVIDLETIPQIKSDLEVRGESKIDFIDGSKALHITLGAIKQAGARIVALEKEVEMMKQKIRAGAA